MRFINKFLEITFILFLAELVNLLLAFILDHFFYSSISNAHNYIINIYFCVFVASIIAPILIYYFYNIQGDDDIKNGFSMNIIILLFIIMGIENHDLINTNNVSSFSMYFIRMNEIILTPFILIILGSVVLFLSYLCIIAGVMEEKLDRVMGMIYSFILYILCSSFFGSIYYCYSNLIKGASSHIDYYLFSFIAFTMFSSGIIDEKPLGIGKFIALVESLLIIFIFVVLLPLTSRLPVKPPKKD